MMNSVRYHAVLNSMTEAARKVYSGVPIAEPWNASQIHAELIRTNASHRDLRHTEGCLNTLVSAGLVYENRRGSFIRAPYRGPTPKPKDTVIVISEDAQEQVMAEAKPTLVVANNREACDSPLDKLTNLSVKLHALAAEIDTVALEIAQQFSDADKQAGKLRQLQSLLKEMV